MGTGYNSEPISSRASTSSLNPLEDGPGAGPAHRDSAGSSSMLGSGGGALAAAGAAPPSGAAVMGVGPVAGAVGGVPSYLGSPSFTGMMEMELTERLYANLHKERSTHCLLCCFFFGKVRQCGTHGMHGVAWATIACNHPPLWQLGCIGTAVSRDIHTGIKIAQH